MKPRTRHLTIILLCLGTVSALAQRGTDSSGSGPLSAQGAELLLALDRLQASRWYPSTSRSREDALADEALLTKALTSSNTELRRLAVRGVGRFERPTDVRALARFLADTNPVVRREAVHAIAQAVVHSKDDEVMPAYLALITPQPPLRNRSGRPLQGPEVIAIEQTRFESIARLHYTRLVAQQVLQTLAPVPGVPSGYTRAMLVMLRQNPGLELTNAQLQSLLENVRPPRDLPSPEVFEILQLSGHLTTPLIVAASAYRCPDDKMPYSCSALRELGVQNLIADNPAMTAALETALKDPWPDVRVHALRRVGEAIKRTHDCGPLLETLKNDGELAMVKLEAIGLLDPRCNDIKEVVRLAREYSVVSESVAATPSQGWPLRARAIEVLAGLDAPTALDALEHAARDVWQVRAARARAAVTLRANDRLREYANDDDPNVRAEALRCLSRLRDPLRIDLAIRNLDSDDYELVATSADILEHAAAPVEAAMSPLWSAFQRLTQESRETARFPRLAILACLEAWTPPRDNISPVRTYIDDLRVVLRDADPIVAEAASRIIGLLTGVKPVAMPIYRPPVQPDVSDLTSLPASATITLDGGEQIVIAFLREEAPIAVARFVKLARTNYFTGQALYYRLAPFIAANGGSPGANDLSGDARFWRDEIGFERHAAGAIGLLSHGRDTADGRFFIDLTDQPAFDYEYTLFARITKMRLTEPWPFLDPPPPMSALVRGGNILVVR